MTDTNSAAALFGLRDELGGVFDMLSGPLSGQRPTFYAVHRAKAAAVKNDTRLVRGDVVTPVEKHTLEKGPFEAQRVADLLEVIMHLEMEHLGVRPCRVSVNIENRTTIELLYRITFLGAIVD